MYKNILAFITLCLCCLLLGCQGGAQEKETLTLGTSADYPPFSFQCRGSFEGFEIELAKAIAKQLDRELIIKDMDFPALIPALNAGQVDFVMASLSMTEARKKNIDFTVSYYTVAPAVIVQTQNASDTFNFDNKKIGVQLGSTLEALAKEKALAHQNIEIFSTPKNLQLIEDLKLGRLDAVMVEVQQAIAFTEKNPNLTYKVLEENSTEWAIGVRKGAPITQDINKALEVLQANGTIQKLEDKWIQ